jgi:sugar lactone lactonase YvrE
MKITTPTIGRGPSLWLRGPTILFSFFLFASVGLYGCGGGGGEGGSSSVDTPPPPTVVPPPPPVSVFAGFPGGGAGNSDGTPGRMSSPGALAIDASGNVFVGDNGNCNVRKITGSILVTFVGGQAGCNYASSGIANSPYTYMADIAVSRLGELYVVANGKILKTAAGGTPASAPTATGNYGFIAIDQSDTIYAFDFNEYGFYRINPDGTRVLIAGGTRPSNAIACADGVGANAIFCNPRGLAIGDDGVLYVADQGTQSVRKITRDGVVSTFASADAKATAVATGIPFNDLSGITVDISGNVYTLERYNTIRKITPGGVVTTILSNATGTYGAIDGNRETARFKELKRIAVDKAGNVLVSDPYNFSVRRISPQGDVTTIAGTLPVFASVDGVGQSARFSSPTGLAIDGTGTLYVADTGNNTIRKVSVNSNVTTLAGTSGPPSSQDGIGSAASLYSPTGLALDSTGNTYFTEGLARAVRKVSSSGAVSTITRYPVVSLNRFSRATGSLRSVAADQLGTLYVVDDDAGSSLRKLPLTGAETLVSCGADCVPNAVATDSLGNIFVATRASIRRISPSGTNVVIAGDSADVLVGWRDGSGADARFSSPRGLTVDKLGNVFVADTGNHVVRKVSPAGVVTTVAGKPDVSGVLIGALPGQLNSPQAIVVDGSGNLFVTTENAVVKIVP